MNTSWSGIGMKSWFSPVVTLLAVAGGVTVAGLALREAPTAAWASSTELASSSQPAASGLAGDPDVQHAMGFSAAFQKVAKEVTPAVVNITATKGGEVRRGGQRQQQPNMSPQDEFFRRFFGDPFGEPQGPMRMPESQSFGSGVVISADGYILTNNHVIEDAREVRVSFADGRTMEAKVVGTDPATDVGVLKVEPSGTMAFAKLGDSDKVNVGEWVLAIGNPFQLSQSVTSGIISAKGRQIDSAGNGQAVRFEDFLQTDAAINPGNSGGPLVNLRGEVIGINTAIFSRSGGYMGIGFAIPSNLAAGIKEQLVSNGKVERGWLGVSMQNLDENTAKSLGLNGTQGVLVTDVTTGSPAESAGLAVEDVITEVNGRPTPNMETLRSIIGVTPPGRTVEVKLNRAGETKSKSVTLGNRDQALAAAGQVAPATNPLGVGVQLLTPDQAQERLGDRRATGVIVTDVNPNSAGAELGLQPDDILLQINRIRVNDVEGFRRAMEEVDRSGLARVVYRRGNMNIIGTIRLR
ncbi:MAG: DegQ family serine endoprotease [bacterium]